MNFFTGITIESERFPNFAKEGQKEMTLIDINANNEDDIVRFVEVSEQPENVEQFQIIESVRNTKPFQPEVGPKDNKMCLLLY